MKSTKNMKLRAGVFAVAAVFATAAPAAEPLPLLRSDPCPDGAAVLAAQTPADHSLEKAVRAALDEVALDRLTDIEVVAIGTTVCLRGRAANTTDYHRAEEAVAAVGGVVDVENRLKIPLAE